MFHFRTILCLFLCAFATASCLDKNRSTPADGNSGNLPAATAGEFSDSLGSNTALAASPFLDKDFVRVSIPVLNGLEVQRSEVTYAQWNALNAQLPLANQTPWEAQRCPHKEYIANGFGENYPAGCISLNDAEAYIQELNRQDANYVYRLPTALELGILTDKTFHEFTKRGQNIPSDEILSRVAWFNPESGFHAHEVCTKEIVLGLCDILGNVWEWTSTRAPRGQLGWSNENRVLRGGSWSTDAQQFLQLDKPYAVPPGLSGGALGFRLVRTPRTASDDHSGDKPGDHASTDSGADEGNASNANQTPSFLDFRRKSDGSPMTMDQRRAVQYCAINGAHLPTARELALLAMSFGARGIVDSCGSDKECSQERAKNADGTVDTFYFSSAGYQRPAGDLGDYSIWSSSISSRNSKYAFTFSGSLGVVSDFADRDSDDHIAVRCVSHH